MLALVIVATLFATQTYGQNYDPIACGAARPNHLYTNETSPGAITSPYYDMTYPNNSRCEWHIHAQDDAQVVHLEFFNVDIEYCTGCKCDALEVYNGVAPDPANLIGTYCGVKGVDPMPDYVTASGPDMYVRFRSDGSSEFRGFIARYSYPLTYTACTAQRPQVETRAEGIIYSTNWPVNYPSNDYCEWRLEAPAGMRISLMVHEFNTEDCCTCDYLDIHDGPNGNAPRFGRWFGPNRQPPVLTTSSNVAFVRFNSDPSVVNTGFMLHYEHVAA